MKKARKKATLQKCRNITFRKCHHCLSPRHRRKISPVVETPVSFIVYCSLDDPIVRAPARDDIDETLQTVVAANLHQIHVVCEAAEGFGSSVVSFMRKWLFLKVNSGTPV